MRAGQRTFVGRRQQEGLLLLEALIAILIFSIGLLGMVAMQARAVQFSVDAEDRNRAALLANDIVSTMWAQQTVDTALLADDIAAWQTRVRAALPPFDDTVTASVGTADSNGVVTVSIGWTPNGANPVPHTYLTQVSMP